MRPQEIKALTGLRGAAAFWVVIYHYSYEGTIGPRIFRVPIGHGYLAVDLFFILSGFVMALTYANTFRAQPGWQAYRDFLWRRLARVYPLYAVLSLMCAVIAYAGLDAAWRNVGSHTGVVLANLAMIQSFGIGLSLDLPAWSISTEFAAYLLFPLLCAVALFRGWRTACAVAAVSACAIIVLSLVPVDWSPDARRGVQHAWLGLSDGRSVFPLIRTFAGFTLGLLTWRAWSVVGRMWLRGRWWPALAVGAALAGLLCLRNVDALTVLLMPLLILCLAADLSLLTRLLGGRVFEFLGLISYSIYLVHSPVRDIVEYFAPRFVFSRLAITGFELAVTLVVSYGTYRLIERPARRALQLALAAHLRWRSAAA
jgi:peptidoglycan/LPS O-acetylase OafA/YrhL